MIEVEVKVRDWGNVEKQINALGGVLLGVEEHFDVYFNHSSRDFRNTDEALRLRKMSSRVELTYKGPRVGSISKTREEITLRVSDFDMCREMLKKLSFREVVEVFKVRRTYRLNGFKINLDNVMGLGRYVEVEVEAPSISDVPNVEGRVKELLEKLGFHKEQFIRKSYLELILESRK